MVGLNKLISIYYESGIFKGELFNPPSKQGDVLPQNPAIFQRIYRDGLTTQQIYLVHLRLAYHHTKHQAFHSISPPTHRPIKSRVTPVKTSVIVRTPNAQCSRPILVDVFSGGLKAGFLNWSLWEKDHLENGGWCLKEMDSWKLESYIYILLVDLKLS